VPALAYHGGPRRYQRREPETTPLYGVLQRHLETFLEHGRADDAGLPRFVEKELRRFLSCGILSEGFARFHCDGCGFDRLVAFSCKGRGFCPSCGGKRMTRMAQHLNDHVVPPVPIRQYVLSFPHALRYRLAYDHALCSAALGIFASELQRDFQRRAARLGLDRVGTGGVTFIQRHGSALNLNMHFHTQWLDGVFVAGGDGGLRFEALPEPTDTDLAELLASVHARMQPLLRERGLGEHDDGSEDPLSLENPTLAAHLAGSVQQLAAFGPRAGKRPTRLGAEPHAAWIDKHLRCHAELAGFDLHAGVTVPGHAYDRREQLFRYVARPAISHDRLTLLEGDRVRLTLKTPYFDGTTHLILEPEELISRLAALIPRPHKNQLVYHGVLAPNARLRSQVVRYGREAAAAESTTVCTHDPAGAATAAKHPSRPNPGWAQLMQRAFDLDVLRCPRCSARLRLCSLMTDRSAARHILRHLGLRDHAPPLSPARRPPDLDHVA
jgi:hypothetical protein